METWWIFFLSLLILISCQSDQKNWLDDALVMSQVDRTAKAVKYAEKNRFYQGSDWSQRTFDTLIMLDPSNEKYYRQKSVPLTKRGDFHEAIPLLEKSLEVNSKENLYYYSWLTLFHYRDYEKALKLFHQYDDLTPNVRDYAMGMNVNYLKGLTHRQLGNYEKAIEEFDQVIQDEGEQAEAHVYTYKGICWYLLGEYKRAITSLDQGIDKFDKNSMSMYYKSMCYEKLDSRKEAIFWIKKAARNILKGNKKDHPYYEVFDEVHYEQMKDQAKLWGIQEEELTGFNQG